MKRRNIILMTALLASFAPYFANTAKSSEYDSQSGLRRNQIAEQYADSRRARVTDTGTKISSGKMNVLLDINTGNIRIRKNQKLVIQPVLIEKRDTVYLPPITVYGKIRYKYDQRMNTLYGTPYREADVYKAVVTGRTQADDITYDLSLPNAPSLYGSRLAVIQRIYGCGNSCIKLGSDNFGTIVPTQTPLIVYMVTPAPQPQLREESLRAYLTFPFDQAVLKRDYMNNAEELARMDSMTAAVNENQIRRVLLTGFASPEGSWTYNDGLSKRRMQTVKGYVENTYGLNGLVDASNVPEDWEGLREWVENSDIEHRDEVLRIIDTVSDPDARDEAIRRIDGGATYRTLLRRAYPYLRHVDYSISYEIAPRSIESARAVFRENPEKLTIYELYMVADSYPSDSEEYGNTWNAICTLYPEDQTALHNAAAAAIRKGDYESAKRYMGKQKDCPEKLNNMGAIAFHNGDYSTAERYFTEAAKAGCSEAAENLKNIYYK